MEGVPHTHTVVGRIAHRTERFRRLPFFEFLHDELRPVTQRLAFVPCMAGFAMSLGDLHRHVLLDEPTADPLQAQVNAHTREQHRHGPWCLDDLEALGVDCMGHPTQTLRALYAEDCVQGRLLAHRLAHWVWCARPKVRLAILQVIDETGLVLYESMARLAAQHRHGTRAQTRSGPRCGHALEAGRSTCSDRSVVATIRFDDQESAEALAAVDAVFDGFTAWTHELHAYVLARHGGFEARKAPAWAV
jgi:hypothetical protein